MSHWRRCQRPPRGWDRGREVEHVTFLVEGAPPEREPRKDPLASRYELQEPYFRPERVDRRQCEPEIRTILRVFCSYDSYSALVSANIHMARMVHAKTIWTPRPEGWHHHVSKNVAGVYFKCLKRQDSFEYLVSVVTPPKNPFNPVVNL